ncbi:hypothetical protein RER_53000 [Rhodococcus erythropolis PR4]|uniref:Uncharacterized protein n=1 Tax=Rhodococcus erythropolis (strain PR4 / NBRC 100887) TaxID=234621 RepID=C0ZS16_RHOE4|nr:hypothetical protein O5Y_25170 [Rhodococcus erythropolis CCM2595]BAH36008.1 hypothetical protein RER_53000 [Rhodococcus erythropolis PR4]
MCNRKFRPRFESQRRSSKPFSLDRHREQPVSVETIMAMFLALVLIISVLGIVGTYLAFSAVYFVEMRKLDK